MLFKALFKFALFFNFGFMLLAFCGTGWLFSVVFFCMVVLLLAGFLAHRFSLKLLLVIFSGFFVGACCFFIQDFSFRVRALKLDGKSCVVDAKVVDVRKSSSGAETYVLKIEQFDENKLFIPIFANIYENKNFKLLFGDRINAQIGFVKKQSYGEFLFSPSRAKNIYLTGKVFALNKVESCGGFFANFFNVRNSLISAVDFSVDEPANFLVSSIFLGQGSRLPYEIRRAFDCCGLSHIFAVSGLHISILFASLIFCLSFLRVPKKFMVLILLFFLVCYNILLGFCVSAIRASLMNLAYFFGTLFNKKLNSVRLLCFVAMFVLVFVPGSVFSCSFFLSFSSCLGILLFFRRISFFIKRRFLIFSGWAKFFIELFAINVSSMVFSSFFLVLFFGKISLVAPIVNLIVMPFVPFILIFSGLVAISGCLGLFNLAAFFGYFCEGIFFELIVLTKFFSKLPFCFLPTRYFFVPIVVGGLIFFLLFVFIYARNLIFTRVVALFFCFIIFVPILNNFVLYKNSSSVSLIGCGSGFSTVINSSGKVIVINCGGFDCERRLCNFLDSRGIKRIDFLIFLSTDLNNMNCDLQTIVNCVETFCVIMPHDIKLEYLTDVLAEKKTNLIFAEQAHFVNFPVSIDFLESVSRNNAFNCYINLGGLTFSYCLSEMEFQQVQKLRFSNVAIVDDYMENFDDSLNCGFLISTKLCETESKRICSVLPVGVSDFLIIGSFIKKMGL